MVEPFLPWWLVLLLGVWVAAVAIWQQPIVTREIRLWAGGLSILYLGLLFLAFGFVPYPGGSNAEILYRRPDFLGRLVLSAISLACVLWMVGRISHRSRRICFVAFTFSNAGFCFLDHAPEIGIGLLTTALISAVPLVREGMRSTDRSPRLWFADLFHFVGESIAEVQSGESWLFVGLNLVLTLTLMGTLAYSLRIETARSHASAQSSALPARDQLDRILNRSVDSTRQPPPGHALNKQIDLAVLIAVIALLSLAVSLRPVSASPLMTGDQKTNPSEHPPEVHS